MLLHGFSNIRWNLSDFARSIADLSLFISLAGFALLITLEHMSFGIELFQQIGISSSVLKWILFLLAIDIWRPFCLKVGWSKNKMSRFSLVNLLILMPACLILLIDSIFSPVDSMVSTYTMAFCFPIGMTIDDIQSTLLPARLNQGLAAFMMIGFHKGSLWVVGKLES